MKREEELTVSVKAEDWENACHELIWLVGDTELFERISNAARMNAEQRPRPTPKPEAEPVAYLTTRGADQRLVLAKFVSDEERDVGSNGWTAIPLYAHPPKPEPVGWETDAEWELEMRCCNITENTPFDEVSKLINDLWKQYCLAAEPKPEAEGVDRQVHHSKPVVSQNTQIVEDKAAHEKGIEPPVSAPLQRETAETWKQVVSLFRKHGLSEPPFRLRDELVIAFEWAWFGYRAALTAKQTDGRDG